jgi:hypothetical protein
MFAFVIFGTIPKKIWSKGDPLEAVKTTNWYENCRLGLNETLHGG